MYTHCLFCTGSLGANAALEHFPVGSRLAFDAKRGRLWVVCPHCERWCLTPLEERWEAIEEAERLFEKTPRRASSTHIGLARTSDGTTLVRIGEPTKLEFAAWRYGDQFGRRRRRNLLVAGGASTAIAAAVLGGPVTGLITAGSVAALPALFNAGMLLRHHAHAVTHLQLPPRDTVVDVGDEPDSVGSVLPADADAAPRIVALTSHQVRRARLLHDERGWRLGVIFRVPGMWWNPVGGLQFAADVAELSGVAATRAASKLLPVLNRFEGSRSSVDDAVHLLDQRGSTNALFDWVARAQMERGFQSTRARALPGTLDSLPGAIRLALEMSVHEERERAALEGELAELERAWRDAEEIAAIADDLLPNPSVTTRLSRLLSG